MGCALSVVYYYLFCAVFIAMAYIDILRQRAKKAITPKLLDSFSPYEVILAPVLTEKAYAAGDVDEKKGERKYFFKVHANATKADVKQSILTIYGVQPVAVNLLWTKEKGRANRKLVKRAYKKAIVTVPAGKKLPVLDV